VRSLQVLALVGCLTIASGGCTVVPTEPPMTSLEDYFYLLKNDARYRYSRFKNIADTVTYKIRLGVGVTEPAKLIQVDPVPSLPTTLYNLSVIRDGYGNPSAIIETPGESRIVALSGDLRMNSRWIASDSEKITAEVIDQYPEYLPNKSVRFEDVLAVRYDKAGDSPSTYILRMYAKGVGLILERRIVAGNTEIGTLQLLSWESGN
jgi:hypothetical protein